MNNNDNSRDQHPESNFSLKEQAKKIAETIDRINQNLNEVDERIKSTWTKFLFLAIIFFAILVLVVYFTLRLEVRHYMSYLSETKATIAQNEQRIASQNNTIEALHNLGGDSGLGQCRNYNTGKTYPCIRVYGGTRENGEYAMIYDETNIHKENLR